MTFAENLKRICEMRGTTPTAVLRELDVATSKVAMWNKGSLPKPEMMTRLAEYLNCSVMDFFADDEYLAKSDKDEIDLDEDEQDIIRIYRTLGRREKHELMSVVYDFEKRTELQGNNRTAN